MPEELTPAERIADNIINGNRSDAKRALRACSKRTTFEVVWILSDHESLETALNRVQWLLP